jgi:NADPH:quinone reductase
MKAAQIAAFGGPEEFHLVDAPVPNIEPDEVLIKVALAGLLYADVQFRSGAYFRDFPHPLPLVLGHEVVGTVEQVGSRVEGVNPGMRVSAELVGAGGYAEYARTTYQRLVEIPDSVSFEHAIIYSFNLPAAYLVYYGFGEVGPEDTVLIHSGAGGLGEMLTRIAKQAGNRVIALTSSAHKVEACRINGADHVIDTSRTNYVDEVSRITGGRGVNACFNHVAGSTIPTDLQVLANRALWNFPSDVGGFGQFADVDVSELLRKSPRIVRSSMESYFGMPEFDEALKFLNTWLLSGDLPGEPTIYPLERVGDAHAFMESRQSVGKIAIKP